ncbi:uncharacterized protein LOC114533469 isoform X2 [Dendronephthya gigantea]|uniref:uncharacterized protein LOC114533469 isoform X2 n=1 Tax=Dendronephthya gigantea TaxID=151771 RepID=UPI001068FC2C|nr:uncharacterized protein LOC114533469 isoform X2 [Dendronephthya gigantea]XP_028410789.1 uncharacterized protein LOC114533469 isoform X2 [Dendronephthya gigantea]
MKDFKCFHVILLSTLLSYNIVISSNQSQITIKAVENKAFDKSCLIKTFNKKGAANIADCLSHCLEDCRCQSFQICQNTECQLCSSHKEENSSLLHDQDGCIYAVYDLRHSLGSHQAQNIDGQCSSIGCSNANCCQRPGLCPGKKICKPQNSVEQPWKRFTCECQVGYSGDNCDETIRSCAGYLDRPRQSGMYKVFDSGNSLYEVYCHFDSDGRAWTLVQSFSFARRTITGSVFQKTLSADHPVSENQLQWSGYRLSKARMHSINLDSNYIAFTCNYKKEDEVNSLDYLQISLDDLGNDKDITTNDPNQEVLTFEGRINEKSLTGCKVKLHQDSKGLHVHLDHLENCPFSPERPNVCSGKFHYFGYFPESSCLMPTHHCTQNVNSTTQLWFGQLKFFT